MNKEYIEREAALKIIYNKWFATCSRISNSIKELPIADVKPVVRGRWYDEDCFDAHGSPIYRCSVCNKTVADHYISEHKYCLHCGAEMEDK